MKFTTVATDAFQKFQLNAGIILTQFDPSNPTVDRSKIFMATSGGASFSATPEFVDFGEDVDNVPANTKEMKVLQSVTAVLSGTGKTVDSAVTKALMAAADVNTVTGKITPRADLKDSDFTDLWWVGDYSDINTDTTDGDEAGFMAIHLLNALSTGGFSLQPNDKGKGDFSFEFTGHYSIDDMTILPYEIYIKTGTEAIEYTYTEVTPVGTENPSEEGWYEYDSQTQTYSASADTTVDSEKTYYTRS